MTHAHRIGATARAVSAIAAAILAPQIALADGPDGPFYGHYGMMDWGGWVFGPIMMVIFFALLVGAIVVIVRLLGGGQFHVTGSHATGGDRALTILRERFAKGEISADDFAAAKKTLQD